MAADNYVDPTDLNLRQLTGSCGHTFIRQFNFVGTRLSRLISAILTYKAVSAEVCLGQMGSRDPAMINGKAPAAYGLTARVLHWITAVLVLTVIPLGIVVRLGYRVMHPPLRLPDDIPPIQRSIAHATHWALYALLIVQPLVGWIATAASPSP